MADPRREGQLFQREGGDVEGALEAALVVRFGEDAVAEEEIDEKSCEAGAYDEVAVGPSDGG